MQHSTSKPVKTQRTKRPKKGYNVRKHTLGDSAKVLNLQEELDLELQEELLEDSSNSTTSNSNSSTQQPNPQPNH